MGTPGYSAPEQKTDPQRVDSRADIYSLGVVFYEMLTGELPGKRLEPPSTKVQIDVRLDEVVLRALEKKPELRYQQVSEVKTLVETIVGTSSNPHEAATRQYCAFQGVDYRSRTMLFGLPLLHVTSGVDPQTGRPRVAKGIIAIGARAQGVFAFGGMATGGFAFGGLAIGVFAFGGCALGLIAFGGLAMALLAALGGGAIAPIAIGGGAIGYLAFGGGAIGAYVLDATTKDPAAVQFFLPWAKVLMANMQWFLAIFTTLVIGIGIGVPLWLWNRGKIQPASLASPLASKATATHESEARGRKIAFWVVVAAMLLNVAVITTISIVTKTAHNPAVAQVAGGPADTRLGSKVKYMSEEASVQDIVQNLAEQVGLKYDRQKSFAQTDPLCRQWVRNVTIDGKTCQQALEQILKPVGLRYQVEDGELVLSRQDEGTQPPKSSSAIGNLTTGPNPDVLRAQLTQDESEVHVREAELNEAQAAQSSRASFGPVMERTLRINGGECDFLVLRTGEVLRHSFVEVGDLRESTPPSAFLQWVRENGVDIGFCFSSNTLYTPLGVSTFEIGNIPIPIRHRSARPDSRLRLEGGIGSILRSTRRLAA